MKMTVKEEIKHSYNMAFCIYALSAYYDAVKDEEALSLAEGLYDLIESNTAMNTAIRKLLPLISSHRAMSIYQKMVSWQKRR